MEVHGVSPSSSPDCEKYDVFLSFKGEDTRNNFTSHLYAALKRKQVEAYIDEKSLERGDEIQLALPEAIHKSKIAIVIFSKDYASSSWCLRELTHILERRREQKQMVIPIFYEVDPSDIRKQEGSYKTSFIKHEDRFKDEMEMANKWRAALVDSADLAGWDSRVTRDGLIELVHVFRKMKFQRGSSIKRRGLLSISSFHHDGIIPTFWGKNYKFKCCFGTRDITSELSTTSNSSNLYMWYHKEYNGEFLRAEEASFDFSFEQDSYDETLETSKLFEVKKCGIHMLHLADLKELGFDVLIA